MTIHEQMPHYILCNYWQVVNTGDREFLAEVWPALNHAMEYVLRGDGMGMGMGGPDGLATTPTAGGVPGESHADNWLVRCLLSQMLAGPRLSLCPLILTCCWL